MIFHGRYYIKVRKNKCTRLVLIVCCIFRSRSFSVRIIPMRIKNKNKRLILIPIAIIIGFVIILLFIPNIQHRLLWRWEIARAYVNGVINPVSAVPTAQVESGPAAPTKPPASQPTTLMTATQAATLVQATPMPTLTPTPLPERVVLDAPVYELQDINNCGPATLTLSLIHISEPTRLGMIS